MKQKSGLIRLESVEVELGTHSLVRFAYPGGELMWDVSEYDKANKSTEDIFKDTNAYWASLPDTKQMQIAEIYHKIHEIFDSESDIRALRHQLQDLLKELYDQMPYEELLEWVRYHVHIRMPNTMRDDYGPNDPPDRQRTYLRRDYQELATFAIALRPMVPIWGEYILRAKKITGTEYKELDALRLLYRTSIIVSEPRQRLQDYIDTTILYEAPNFAAVLKGLGTEERSEWLLALNIIRRVAPGEISSPDGVSSIVTNVYNYTKTKLDQIAKTFKTNVVDKSRPSRGMEEDNVSYLEMFKVKQKVSDGDLQPLELYSERTLNTAQTIDPTIDPKLVESCLKAVSALQHQPTYEHQVVLAQWVVAPAMPPLGIDSVTKLGIMRILAVTQAILWHWELYDLAALTTACPYPMEENQILSNLEGRNRIPKELVEELWVRYPYHQAVKPKAGVPRGAPVRGINYAIQAIELFFELIKPHDWELYCPQELQERTSKIPHTKKLIVPADIRAQLAHLCTKIDR